MGKSIYGEQLSLSPVTTSVRSFSQPIAAYPTALKSKRFRGAATKLNYSTVHLLSKSTEKAFRCMRSQYSTSTGQGSNADTQPGSGGFWVCDIWLAGPMGIPEANEGEDCYCDPRVWVNRFTVPVLYYDTSSTLYFLATNADAMICM